MPGISLSSIYFVAVFMTLFAWPAWCAASGVADRPEIVRFIDEMVTRNNMPRKLLEHWFSHVHLRPEVIKAMDKPPEHIPWYRYRRLFVTAHRARVGVHYWRRHAAVLRRAEQVYGVPASIIVAVLGVESRYGRLKGRYPVLDVLTTLMLNYPRRRAFFRGELEQYLLLVREEGWNPLRLRGSYAGAIGAPQFLASSYRRYAVDFDGDKHRDLVNDSADVIGSVANYLVRHGWRRGGAIVSGVVVHKRGALDALSKSIKPNLSVGQFERRGIVPRERVPENELAALFRLQGAAGAIYHLGFNNFYVITRYNRSVHYAMAVYELSEMILRQYRGHL